MNEIERILKEYRGGDFKKRLDIFLAYRSLRSDFTQIEQDEALTRGAHISRPVMTHNHRSKSVFYPFLRWLKCHYSFID